MISLAVFIAAFIAAAYAIRSMAQGTAERVRKREWWRLWIAGGALALPVIVAIAKRGA